MKLSDVSILANMQEHGLLVLQNARVMGLQTNMLLKF